MPESRFISENITCMQLQWIKMSILHLFHQQSSERYQSLMRFRIFYICLQKEAKQWYVTMLIHIFTI